MSDHIVNATPGSIPSTGIPSTGAVPTGIPIAVARPRVGVSAQDLGTRLRDNLGLMLIYLFLGIMTFFALFPIYFVVQASLRDTQTLYSTTLQLFPTRPTLDNYRYILTETGFLRWMWNSIVVCGAATLLGIVASVTGAYAISRFRFRGQRSILVLMLALQAFPGLLALLAYYLLLQQLQLINTIAGLALVYGGGTIVFGVWNIKGFFDTLPTELEEAAIIDGASVTRTFWSVMLPLAAPAIASSALFMFIGGWSEYALANLILTSADVNGSNLTFPIGLYSLQNDFRTPWGYFAAAAVMASIPLMALFLWLQRYFQSGLTVGSVKG